MVQDRFIKMMLVLIAVLLALNLMRTNQTGLFSSPAQAQVIKGIGEQARRYDVKAVRGFQVNGLQDVVVLGDGKTFVVSNQNGFMVYTIDQFAN